MGPPTMPQMVQPQHMVHMAQAVPQHYGTWVPAIPQPMPPHMGQQQIQPPMVLIGIDWIQTRLRGQNLRRGLITRSPPSGEWHVKTDVALQWTITGCPHKSRRRSQKVGPSLSWCPQGKGQRANPSTHHPKITFQLPGVRYELRQTNERFLSHSGSLDALGFRVWVFWG